MVLHDLRACPLNEAFTLVGCGRSRGYQKINEGLLPRPLSENGRSWLPAGEIRRIQQARIAGAGDAEIRDLVKVLEGERKNLAEAA